MAYYKSCVSLPFTLVYSMTYNSIEISRKTFLKHVDRKSLTFIEKYLGYHKDHKMSSDKCVRYFKSTYDGKPCVYFLDFLIEHVFI